MLRSPTCCVVGHVDSGKTSLLTRIFETKDKKGKTVKGEGLWVQEVNEDGSPKSGSKAIQVKAQVDPPVDYWRGQKYFFALDLGVINGWHPILSP